MLEVIATKVLEKAGESAVTMLRDALVRENASLLDPKKKNPPQVLAKASTTAASLSTHVEEIRRWSSSIRFSDLKAEKLTARVYVEVDTYLMPLKTHMSLSEREKRRPLIDSLAAANQHAVILGSAGAGKTTSLQKVCVDYFKQGKALLNHNFPLLVRLRDLDSSNPQSPIYEKLQEVLSINVHFPDSADKPSELVRRGLTRKAINAYLNELKVVLLLDGYDEIPTVELKNAALSDIEHLATGLTNSRLLLTSRSSDFHFVVPSAEVFEIAPLSSEQIQRFVLNWLGDANKAADLYSKIVSSPFADTAVRPLTIAHLCAIYERIQDIPDKPKSVYRRVVNLLLEEWDAQRKIKRQSAYTKFEVDRKLEFLAHLAYELTATIKTLRFGSETLKLAYGRICAEHGLVKDDAAGVVAEIESHSGLILTSGHGHFEFAHKSIQEFLTADYIVRLPSVEILGNHIQDLPNELAIATALSSRPGYYLSELVLRTVRKHPQKRDWYTVLANRILLEKAELQVGDPTRSAIAVLYLLKQTSAYEDLIELFRGMIPPRAMTHLTSHYSIKKQDSRYYYLIRKLAPDAEELPETLQAPIWSAM